MSVLCDDLVWFVTEKQTSTSFTEHDHEGINLTLHMVSKQLVPLRLRESKFELSDNETLAQLWLCE